MNNLKNTNLEVSSFALGCVEKVVGKTELERKYKTLVKKMSTLIQKNGYIGTLVFCYSKSQKNKEHEEVLKNIINWHKKNYKIKNYKVKFEDENEREVRFMDINDTNFQKYIKTITKVRQNEYMLVTKEMMILFGWMKRFADGMIEGEDENGD